MICSYCWYGYVIAHKLTYCSAIEKIKSGAENWVNDILYYIKLLKCGDDISLMGPYDIVERSAGHKRCYLLEPSLGFRTQKLWESKPFWLIWYDVPITNPIFWLWFIFLLQSNTRSQPVSENVCVWTIWTNHLGFYVKSCLGVSRLVKGFPK